MQISDIEPGHLNPAMREGFGSQYSVLTGLVLLGLSGLACASLASWSVNDPSLSHANGEAVSNLLGYPGAVFADFIMQFVGLAAAVLLIAPALWGWGCLIQSPFHGMKSRLVIWPASILFTSAAFSTLTIPQSWPLPSGLGGVTGDMVLEAIAFMSGFEFSGYVSVLGGTILSLIALVLVFASSGLAWRSRSQASGTDSVPDDDLIDTYDLEDEAPSWTLGALAHFYLSLKSRYFPAGHHRDSFEDTRKKTSLFSRIRQLGEKLTRPDDDGLDEFANAGYDTSQHPHYGENVYNEYAETAAIDAEWAPQAPPHTIDTSGIPDANDGSPGRVQTMVAAPKPSSRVKREAQPSLISMSDFELPSLHFLNEVPKKNRDNSLSSDALEQNARLLEGVLEDFGVKGEIINVRPGPVVTLYELEPAPGIKSSRVIGLADDIARSMSAIAARVAVVPGRNAIGIELPNQNRETVYLREILASQAYENSKAKLPLILGKTIGGESTIADLAKMPHLLVAGTTGSGKSVAINTMILSILYQLNPEQVKMIMIDPKMLELSIYDGIPHLLTPVVTDPKKAVVALKWTVREMEERYKKMSKIGVRNIDGYNNRIAQAKKKNEVITRTIQTGYDRDSGEAIYETEELSLEAMPYIVVIIDEMADLMMVAGKDIEGAIQRLAQMARAAGIHVIMATQRPSVDVITGTIKANFPTRISFQVTSKIDSRTILGEQGAEQLLGMGDMLYMAGGGRIQRVHGPFVGDNEVDQIVTHLKSQGIPEYLDSVTEEDEDTEEGTDGSVGNLSESNDIYDQAVAIVLQDRKVSTSYIQRRLSIGYNRAATLIERMEQEQLISPANHAGKREILVPDETQTF